MMRAIRPALACLLLGSVAAIRQRDTDTAFDLGGCYMACDCENMDFPKMGFERECSTCLIKLGMEINKRNPLMDVRLGHCASNAVVTEAPSSSTSGMPATVTGITASGMVSDAGTGNLSPWGAVAESEGQPSVPTRLPDLSFGECYVACDCENMDFPKMGFEKECSTCLIKLGMEINERNPLMDVRIGHCASKAVATEAPSSSTSGMPTSVLATTQSSSTASNNPTSVRASTSSESSPIFDDVANPSNPTSDSPLVDDANRISNPSFTTTTTRSGTRHVLLSGFAMAVSFMSFVAAN